MGNIDNLLNSLRENGASAPEGLEDAVWTRIAARREAQAAKMGFSAYAVTQSADDPLVIALHRLIDHVAWQDRQIEALQQSLARLGGDIERAGAHPLDAKTLNRMVD